MVPVLILGMLLTACGGSSASSAAPAATGEKITMRMTHAYPETVLHQRNALEFKRLTEQYTNGKVEVIIYPNAQLGAQSTELNIVLSGTTEASYIVTGPVETLDVSEAIWTLPFIWEVATGDGLHKRMALADKDFFGTLQAHAEALGFVRLTDLPTPTGFFLVANNVKPILTVDDIKGMKIRHPGGLLGAKTIELWGASPMTIAGPEVPVALQQGVVDGLRTHIMHMHQSNWHTKYVTDNKISSYGHPLMVSKAWWDKLPADIRTIFTDKVVPEATDYAVANAEADGLTCMDEATKPPFNMERVTLNEEQLLTFKKLCYQPCIDLYLEKAGADGQKLLDAVIKTGDEVRKINGKSYIAWGK